MTWPMVKIEDIFEVARGGSPRPIDDFITDDPDGVNWIMIGDTKEGGKYIESTGKKIRLEGVKKSRMVHEGDFLLTNSMSFGRPYILKTSGCIHDGWLVLSPKTEELSTDYFYYYLGSEEVKNKLSLKAAGAVVKNLNKDIVKSLEIPLPPMVEQKRIAAILDKADAIRRKRQQAIQLADDFLRAVFLDMFGDPVTNPKGWEVQRIGSLGTAITGATPPGAEKGMWGDEVPFVTPGDLGDVVVSANRYLSQKGVEYSRVCRAGSLMVCCIGATIGKVGISSTPSAFNQQINSLEWSSKVNDFYGYYLFKLFPQLIVKNSIQTTLPILKKSLFENILIPVPKIELQERFESIFNQINKLINRNPSLLNRSLFNALSQKAFRGEL